MAILKLAVTAVTSSRHYALHLPDWFTVGKVAQRLSQYVSHSATGTLEIARPVLSDWRLAEVDIQPGDRLLVFLQPAEAVELPESPRRSESILRFSLGGLVIDSGGKTGLLVGKPDESQLVNPDIDLSQFVAPGALEWISRGCLWLSYDADSRVWYVSKLGQTRVMVDDFELGTEKIPLNDEQWLHFYPADPAMDRALGGFHLSIVAASSDAAMMIPDLDNQTINARVGVEREAQTLRVSDHLPVAQVVTHWAAYNRFLLSPETQLYWARLASPETEVKTLALGQTEFFYAPLNPGAA